MERFDIGGEGQGSAVEFVRFAPEGDVDLRAHARAVRRLGNFGIDDKAKAGVLDLGLQKGEEKMGAIPWAAATAVVRGFIDHHGPIALRLGGGLG